MFEYFHFLRPVWLIAVVPVIVLAIAWGHRRWQQSRWRQAVEPDLLEVLLEPGSTNNTAPVHYLAALALALAALGLAGPSWERLPQPVERHGGAMIILFDLSLSMFVADVAPSRLVRGRQKITDILRERNEGFTALVAYAGDAHIVAPLTDDTKTIENLLGSLSPAMMPVLGSNLAAALDLAEELFTNGGMTQGRIVLVTDGVDDLGDISEFENVSFPISILGVGTVQGGMIPLDFANQPGRVLRTQSGDAIEPKLDESRLDEAADLGHGTYRRITVGDDDINALLDTQLPGDEDMIDVEREFDSWHDRGYWLALVVLPFAMLGFRRGLLAGLAMCCVIPPADANLWDDIWQRRDQQGFERLRDGQPEVAVNLFEDSLWRSSANYRLKQYAEAAQGFAANPQTEALYNLGNATARLGDYRKAIDTYDEVLSLVPDHEDARYNKELIENLLQAQSSDQENNDQQNQGGEDPDAERRPQGSQNNDDEQQPSDDDSESTETQNSQQQDPSEEQQANDPEQDEQGDDGTRESRDEKQEALEQWLRRVPDDPGGLLRRKFQYETNQRRRRGNYAAKDSEKIW